MIKFLNELLEICKLTKNVLIIDTANEGLSISHLIYYKIANLELDIKKDILTMPDNPEPTSYYLTKNFYINSVSIIDKLQKLLNRDLSCAKTRLNLQNIMMCLVIGLKDRFDSFILFQKIVIEK